ncbi:hypothetical protein ACOME3_009550 [Neoechinorhynchus agilis]
MPRARAAFTAHTHKLVVDIRALQLRRNDYVVECARGTLELGSGFRRRDGFEISVFEKFRLVYLLEMTSHNEEGGQDGSWEAMISPPPSLTEESISYQQQTVPTNQAYIPIVNTHQQPIRFQYALGRNPRMPTIPSLMTPYGPTGTSNIHLNQQHYAQQWASSIAQGAIAGPPPVAYANSNNAVMQMAAAAVAAAAQSIPGQVSGTPGHHQHFGSQVLQPPAQPPNPQVYNNSAAMAAGGLDPNVIALMQNPPLAYKLISAFFSQQSALQQQQQALYGNAAPLLTSSEVLMRQQLHNQQQQQQQQHYRQQELCKNLKSLSMDDASTSMSTDSQRRIGLENGATSAIAVGGTKDNHQPSSTNTAACTVVNFKDISAKKEGGGHCESLNNRKNGSIETTGYNSYTSSSNIDLPTQRGYNNRRRNSYRNSSGNVVDQYCRNSMTFHSRNQRGYKHEYRSGRRSQQPTIQRRSATKAQRQGAEYGNNASNRWDAIRDLAYSYRKSRVASDNNSQRRFEESDGRGEQRRGVSAGSTEMLPPNSNLESILFGNPSAGINFDQYEKIPVDTKGFEGLDPIMSFREMDFHPILANNICLARYDKPTPVQKYTIPAIINNRDIMSCAQTGSGKTAAFLFPIINQMLKGSMLCKLLPKEHNPQSPRCLILAPTRELCLQIFNEARKFSYRSFLRVVVVYGGTNLRQQLKEIYRGVDIVVATPGRLIDVVERHCLLLNEIRYFVLDEADRMLDMGFEPQIRRIVDSLDMPDKTCRQTSMFSATFPKSMRELAQHFLRNYVFLAVGRIGSTSENIEQRILWVDEHRKLNQLKDILDSYRSDAECGADLLTLIFVETKRGADELENVLRKEGYNVGCIHGDRNQSDREYALNQFRNSHITTLVATAVAARGLDVPNVCHVINYDLPTDIDDYVHRIGRTGRGGNKGIATSFFCEKNANIASDLVAILRESKQEVPDFLVRMHGSSTSRYRRMDNRRVTYRGARSATFRHYTRHSSRHHNHHQYDDNSGYAGRRFSTTASSNTTGMMMTMGSDRFTGR